MTEREKSLLQVQIYDFVCWEMALYLDTHPEDAAALEYRAANQKLAEEAAAAYVENYAPLRIEDCTNSTRWCWVDGPWPWEYGGEG